VAGAQGESFGELVRAIGQNGGLHKLKPLCIDLFCGLGGWADGFLAEGYDVVGFDIERHVYGEEKYPAQLVLQDVLTLHGSQFRNAAVIVASPPCQAYSYRAMPWKRAKALPAPSNELFEACFRIAKEADVPLIVENVRGAEKWVGAAAWHFGSYYLWGDVPALMPRAFKAVKVPSFRFDGSGRSFHTASVRRTDPGKGARFTSRDCGNEKGFAKEWRDSPNGMPMMSSKSPARKAASAQIAKIPFPLAQHIARVFKPEEK
jgi:site-specific DNA-cytosine methylase